MNTSAIVKIDRSVFGTEILGELIPYNNLSKEYKQQQGGQQFYEDGYVVSYQSKLISISRDSYNNLLFSGKLKHINS